MRSRLFPLLSAGALWACCLTACTTQEKSAPGTRMIVHTQRAAFFKYGPAQTFGADFQLTQGQTVTLLDRSVGYSHVLTENGVTGYVSNEDLKPAPAPAVAPRPPSKAPKHSNVEPVPAAPLFDVSDLPALPEGPEKKPERHN